MPVRPAETAPLTVIAMRALQDRTLFWQILALRQAQRAFNVIEVYAPARKTSLQMLDAEAAAIGIFQAALAATTVREDHGVRIHATTIFALSTLPLHGRKRSRHASARTWTLCLTASNTAACEYTPRPFPPLKRRDPGVLCPHASSLYQANSSGAVSSENKFRIIGSFPGCPIGVHEGIFKTRWIGCNLSDVFVA